MMRHLALPSRRARTSCSVLALATVLVVGATPASAQSFLGTGTVTSGTGTISTGPSTTSISVTTPQTVIDWTPFDNAIANNTTIAFQNSGTTASFSGSGNFAVLNRINPADSTRSITMNGLIQAIPAGAAGSANGSIYFYTPGGIVLGSSSVINVGSLVLTTSPITVTAGSFINGASNTVVFGQAPRATAAITTNSGSQITANGSDAYVAMVAPRVQHGGTINVSGSAALVGAEAATINFSPDGLFDIQVTTGTTDANGVYSSGTITGAASTGAADTHRAYLVAVPKNSALTMAVIQGGSLGFNIAGAANVSGNTVVLSAGYNITDGVINTAPASAGGANKANLNVTGANMTSALTAAASGIADIFSTVGQTSNFASDVTVRAVDHVWVNAGASASLNIAGNLDMSAVHGGSVDGQSHVGGFLALYALPGGTVTVGGNATLTSLGFGGSSATGGLNGGAGTGGSIWVQSEGNSTVAIGGNLTAWAGGYGGSGGAAGANGGAGNGGQILIRTFAANSLLTVGGSTSANADGYGGDANACLGCSGSGGIGTGGTVSVYTGSAAGSSMTLDGVVSLQASGHGGSSATGGAGGSGTGGPVIVSAGAGSTLALNDRLYAAASGVGGSGSTGGNALGGNISIYSSGILTIGGIDDTNLFAEATGGMGLSAAAGDGQGGTIYINAADGGSLALNGLSASADAWGGHAGGAGADGGDATGGEIALYPTGDGSSITAQSTNLHANAFGGRGDGLECFSCDGDGGNAKGGGVFVGDTFYVVDPGVGNSIDFTGTLTMSANGTGGVGVGTSGNGTGGLAELSWYDGIVGSVTGNVSINSVGRGGNDFAGGIAGNGYGFGAIIGPDGGLTLGADVNLDASGIGGSAYFVGGGTGGIGDGGVARLFNGLGTISIAGNHQAIADGVGGNAYLGTGGAGIGGLAPLNASDSEILIGGWADLSANGTGGDGNIGGDGTGGTARLITSGNNGNIAIGGYASVDASGFGGNGASGFGGDGLGGLTYLTASSGADLAVTGSLFISADGFGGDGNSGGAANGGISFVGAEADGSVAVGGILFGSADAFGGYGVGGPGGDAYGGSFLIYSVGDGSSATFSNLVLGSTDAFGGQSVSGTGGYAEGGFTEAFTEDSGYALFDDDLSLSAWGFGGDGLTGGAALGGEVNLYSSTGGSLFVTGLADLSVDAWGGDSDIDAGGNANGGNTTIYADGSGSIVTVSGEATVSAEAEGGSSEAGVGGETHGGNIDIYAQNSGNLKFEDNLSVSADAQGGSHTGAHGFAGGGNVSIYSLATLQVDGSLTATATATGGDLYFTDGSDFTGATAFGGEIDVYAAGGSLTVVGAVTLSTNATGGAVENDANTGGFGKGGKTFLYAIPGGTIDFQSTLDATARGSGGEGSYYGGLGGNGQGGQVAVQAAGTNASVTVAGATYLSATGLGSSYNGGNGSGGIVAVEAFSAATASLNFLGDLEMYASGFGGDNEYGPGGTGGNGQGGLAFLYASGGSTVHVGGDATVSTDAFGGYSYDFSDGSGGDAIGGESRIQAFTDGTGGTIAIDGSAYVWADGSGGDSYSLFGGSGGDGTGGTAELNALTGTITIGAVESGAGVEVLADGYGGNADNGTGGDGTGGELAQIWAQNGDITIEGFAAVSASGFGGDGLYGGNGLGSGETFELGGGVGGAHIVAQNGAITINGGAGVWATGSGGDGGGDFGYGGDYGGDGGNGTGGWATIDALNSDLGPSSISIDGGGYETSGFAEVDVSGEGGDGGDGIGGNLGGDGGNGGTGRGGVGSITANAGNGTVAIGSANIDAQGDGGDGGDGGNGDGLAGGNGGDGGAGFGGYGTIGTRSGNGQSASVNDGFGDYGFVNIDSSATGGFGGDGNFGATNGAGGNGGDAVGGASVLLVRGSRVDADMVWLNADATGGDGGFGDGETSSDGNGGNASVGGDGGIGVVASGRYLIPTQRGTLNAGSITGTAIANGGSGLANGASENLGGSAVTFLNADGNIGSLDILVQADAQGVGAANESISVINGDVAVDGEFSFVTSGNLSLFANNGDMHSGILTLSAGNFVFDPVNDPPSDRGTYFADSATITTGNNFVTSANLDIGSSLVIDAPGLINAYNFTIDGDLDLFAHGGGITAHNLDVAGKADLDATGAILLNIVQAGFFHADTDSTFTSDDITSDSNIQIFAGDDVTLGDLVAGATADINSNKAVRIDSDGSVLVGNIVAVGGIDISATDSVTGGNITSGDGVFTDAGGAIIYGNISGGLINPVPPSEPFSVGIESGTSIFVGNVEGSQSIGFATLGPITTGTINTGADFLVMASGNMLFGPITAAGRVYLADSSMFIAAGGGGEGDDDDFDPELVFGATPVPSLGSITINGPTLAGSFQAAAGTFFSSGAITTNGLLAITAGTSINVGAINAGAGAVSLIAGGQIGGSIATAGSIYADSGTDIFLGNLTATGDIELVAIGDILVGNALAGETIDLDAGGYIDGGNMTAGDSVYAIAGESIDLLNISAGLVNQSDGYDADYNVGLLAGTTIDTGNIAALNSIGIGAQGNIYTGNIDAGEIFLALGGGNMSFGTINSGGTTYLADDSMILLGGNPADGDFDPAPILAATPVASGGSITLRGPAAADSFRASAGITFTAGVINSTTNILIDSGGNMTLGNLGAGLMGSGSDSDNAIRLDSNGSIVMGNATALDGIDFDATGSVTAGNLTSGRSVIGGAGGAIILGNLSGGIVNPQGPSEDGFSVGVESETSISVGNVAGAESVGFASLGSVTTGNINAGDDFLVLATGNMSLGTINAGGRVYLAHSSMFTAAGGGGEDDDFDAALVFALQPVATGGSITTGAINAESVRASAGTTLTSGNVVATGLVSQASGAALLTGNVTAGSDLYLTSGAGLTGGNLAARTRVRLTAAGAVNVGNITINTPSAARPIDGVVFDTVTGAPVEVFAASINTGNINTNGYVGLYTPGSLSVGTINAGHDVIALVGTNAQFGTIKTDERFLLGGYGMFAALNGGESFNPALAFSATKTRTGGTATFAGATASNFAAYIGGLATLNGAIKAGNVTLVSSDIDIAATGGIDAGTTGSVLLQASGNGGALIGDNVTGGGGYKLSNAEFGRIKGGDIAIVVGGFGGDADTRIGDLTITGPAAGSNVQSSGGGVTFVTLGENGDEIDGTLRVTGNIAATGFGPDNYLDFVTEHFELDAAIGSIAITGNGGALSGVLGLYSPDIFIASGAILDKLEVNPRYSGYIAELNAPAAVQRPDGVIRAAAFDIDGGESGLQNLLVQNTGTTALPAGFVINSATISDDTEGDLAAGSVNMVINGQIIGESGTLTGIAVRDFLVTEFGTTAFVATSTINGCVLVGPCTSPPPPQVDTVAPTDVQLTGGNGLGDGLFGNEGDIDDGESGDEGDLSSPISPPVPLFDSRPLDQSGDVDDPVSGAGNPSLYGNPDDDADAEVCDSNKDKKCSTNAKGDGK